MASDKKAITSFRYGVGLVPTYRFLGILCVLLLLPVRSVLAEESELITRTLSGQTQILSRDYEGADQIFQGLIRQYPEHPAGYFGVMALLETRMLENDDFRFEKEYLAAAEAGLKVMDQLPGRKRVLSQWDRFILSAGYGLHGFHFARKGSWWKAYFYGSEARHFLKQLIWNDPNFYDAGLGLGLYDYYRSVYTRILRFLPFFPDKRAEGISQVEMAIEKGKYSHDLGLANLALIDLREHQWIKAESVLADLLQHYPNNIIFRIYLGSALTAEKKYAEAETQFKKILAIDSGIARAKEYLKEIARLKKKG